MSVSDVITQLAKLSFNHPSVVLTADVFQFLIKTLKTLKNQSAKMITVKRKLFSRVSKELNALFYFARRFLQ